LGLKEEYLNIYHQNKIIYHQFYHQKTQEASGKFRMCWDG